MPQTSSNRWAACRSLASFVYTRRLDLRANNLLELIAIDAMIITVMSNANLLFTAGHVVPEGLASCNGFQLLVLQFYTLRLGKLD